jgi:hypothetical protein
MTACSGMDDTVRGHRPGLFKGQKAANLSILRENRGRWVPARIFGLRRDGYVIENKTELMAGKVHGAFRPVACSGETGEVDGGR